MFYCFKITDYLLESRYRSMFIQFKTQFWMNIDPGLEMKDVAHVPLDIPAAIFYSIQCIKDNVI